MKRGAGIILLLTAGLLASAAIVNAQSEASAKQEDPLVVIKAVAPSGYPAIAVAARAEGVVIIEVTLSASGEIKGARAIEGPALLQKLALVAARRWQFAPNPNSSKDRMAQLSFRFRLVTKKEDEQTSFKPPVEIEYAFAPPKVVNTVNY